MKTYDAAKVHGHHMKTKEIARVVEKLARVPLEIRKDLPGLEPKRADVIIAGGLVAIAFLEKVGASQLTVSDRGVRWGLAEDLLR